MTKQTEYRVVEHYPDGNSSGIALLPTLKEAQDYIKLHWCENCTIEKVHTITIPLRSDIL